MAMLMFSFHFTENWENCCNINLHVFSLISLARTETLKFGLDQSGGTDFCTISSFRGCWKNKTHNHWSYSIQFSHNMTFPVVCLILIKVVLLKFFPGSMLSLVMDYWGRDSLDLEFSWECVCSSTDGQSLLARLAYQALIRRQWGTNNIRHQDRNLHLNPTLCRLCREP